MLEDKTISIEEFQKRYGIDPGVFITVQKYGTIIFHPNYETLQEILFYDFEINDLDKKVSYKEIVGTNNENPFFKIYESNNQKFKELINYDPHKKNTSVINEVIKEE